MTGSGVQETLAAAARFGAEQPGWVDRVIDRHTQRADGSCAGCGCYPTRVLAVRVAPYRPPSRADSGGARAAWGVVRVPGWRPVSNEPGRQPAVTARGRGSRARSGCGVMGQTYSVITHAGDDLDHEVLDETIPDSFKAKTRASGSWRCVLCGLSRRPISKFVVACVASTASPRGQCSTRLSNLGPNPVTSESPAVPTMSSSASGTNPGWACLRSYSWKISGPGRGSPNPGWTKPEPWMASAFA